MWTMLAGFAHAQEPDSAQIHAPDSLLTESSYLTSEFKLFMQLIIGLAIVIILLIITLWVLKYIIRFRFSSIGEDAIQVLAMRYIEPKKAIALVRVMDRVFVIGIAEQALTNLGELSPEETGNLNLDAQKNQQPFGTILSRLRTKFAKPS